MDTLFISDLHLSPARPGKIELFKRLLRGPALEARALYILGDLFDHFWVGNDDRTPPNPEICQELLAFSEKNKSLFIMRGNRDLMMRDNFSEVSGCSFLPDEKVIEVDGTRLLISHGDLYCTEDVSYQRYRRFINSGFTNFVFPRLPYAVRIRLAHGLRPAFKNASSKKNEAIIDVEQSAVEAAMTRHAVQHLVHGHTHRSGMHEFELGGQPATRTVLPDWYEDDGLLVCRGGERILMRVEEYLG